MTNTSKTLYLWDVAGTLFSEQWSAEKSGKLNLVSWIEDHLGTQRTQMTDREYEEAHKEPYRDGLMDLDVMPGFREMLEWAKYNETFSTGNVEQMDWRAENLISKLGYDFRPLFQKFNSTFDYGATNVKTRAMLVDYLTRKFAEGFRTIVYTDDMLENLQEFEQAAQVVKRKYKDLSWRLYQMVPEAGAKLDGPYEQVQSLLQLMDHERKIR